MQDSSKVQLRISAAVIIDESFESAPERKLLAACLERALLDLRGLTDRPGSTKAQEKRESAAWIFSNDEHPWSLVWMCNEMDISVASIRKMAKDILGEAPVLRFNTFRRGGR